MKWSEIRVHTITEAIEPISNILNEHGANGVIIEDPHDLFVERESKYGELFELKRSDYPEEGVYIKAYFPKNSMLGQIIEQLKEQIYRLKQMNIEIGNGQIAITDVEEVDWETAWKKYYKIVNVSEQVTIVPAWKTYTPQVDDEVIIKLDPGMAFGTGTHPTTKLSIQALEKYLQKDDIVYDVGCGSGVLSIASILLGAKEVFAYDLDETAVNSTTYNAQLNQLEQKIYPKQNNLLQGIEKEVDLIVSNILAEIIIQLISDAYKNLKHGGFFITSGIIKERKQLVLDRLQSENFTIVATNELDDWVSIIAKKL